MHFFKPKKKDILPLYNKIVFLTRKSFFYKDLQLSDSFSIRIYLLFFHLCFIIIALKNKECRKDESQEIFDFFFKQIEINCRELGHGDTTINKKMKDLIRVFYEILINCHNWNHLKISKKNDLLSKFFSNNHYNETKSNKLTTYFDKFSFFIEDISLNSLTKGVFNFSYKE